MSYVDPTNGSAWLYAPSSCTALFKTEHSRLLEYLTLRQAARSQRSEERPVDDTVASAEPTHRQHIGNQLCASRPFVADTPADASAESATCLRMKSQSVIARCDPASIDKVSTAIGASVGTLFVCRQEALVMSIFI
jgi:hypothetical protein